MPQFIKLVPFVKDIFGSEAASSIERIMKNLLILMAKANDSHVLTLLQRVIHLVSISHPMVVDKMTADLLQTAAVRLKGRDLSQEGRNAVINAVRHSIAASSKSNVEMLGSKVVDMFSKSHSGKESLASYQLIESLYKVVAKHGIASLDDKICSTSESLIEAAGSKTVELKIKKTVIEAFGPLIVLRKNIGTKTLERILEVILSSLNLEALHFPCIEALQHFSRGVPSEGNSTVNTTINAIVEKLILLFASKNKIYQVNIIKVIEALHKDASIELSDSSKQSIVEAFSSLLEKCDISTAKIIAKFVIQFEDKYRKFDKDIKCAVRLMLNLALTSSTDDEFLETLVAVHKTFIPASDYEKKIDAIYDQTKKDPNTEVAQASLCLYFLFQSLPDVSKLVQEIVEEIVSKRSANFCLSLSILGHLGYTKDFSSNEALLSVITKACASTEAKVKLSGIKCLAGMGVHNLDKFKSVFNDIIPKNVENRMFFFNVVQTIFQYLSAQAPKDCTAKYLAYLHEFVEVVEESERAELFKAYGSVLQQNPGLIESTFKRLAEERKTVYQILGASICRQIFSKHLDLNDHTAARQLLTASVDSTDPDLETAAFVSLDAIHCSNPHAVEKLLNMQFCHTMAQKMLANQALVEKIEMGMFSHKIDYGLPLRKACFSFLFRLSKADKLNLHPFLGAVVAGLGDENEDVKYLATRVVKEGIMDKDQTFLLNEFSHELAASLEKSLKSFKLRLTTIVQEKGATYQTLKSLISLIRELSHSAEFSTNAQIKAMENDILNNASFKDVIGSQ